jgi:Sec-independent protein translocase protein TatA
MSKELTTVKVNFTLLAAACTFIVCVGSVLLGAGKVLSKIETVGDLAEENKKAIKESEADTRQQIAAMRSDFKQDLKQEIDELGESFRREQAASTDLLLRAIEKRPTTREQ